MILTKCITAKSLEFVNSEKYGERFVSPTEQNGIRCGLRNVRLGSDVYSKDCEYANDFVILIFPTVF